ncbi:MAG: heat-inducible transcriptional repressor [Gammaproteobacteria bacterium]|jgi:heat-inducible transcriptional repressor
MTKQTIHSSDNPSQLSERSLFLFKSLVEHFINDGQPVGSRTLSRDIALDLSSATIRNIMADLEDLGLLQSPHTSAGRIPTAKGYRLFVDNLLRVNNITEVDVSHITRELDKEYDTQMLMEKTSNMLSEITRLAGVVMLPRQEKQVLKQIEFVSLSDNRILVILIMNDKEVQNRVIHTARNYSASELQEASNYLNQHYSGKDLDKVRETLLADLVKMRDDVNNSMQLAIEFASNAFGKDGHKDDFVLAGQTNLMDFAELCDVDKLKRLFESFNHKRDLLHLLEQAINAKGVQIFIGEESGYEVLDNCSVVTSPYEVDGRILGVLGVIGPTRMNYERIIPIVDITAKMLGIALNSTN